MKLNILFLTQDDRMVLEFIGYTLEESLKDSSIGIFDAQYEKEAIDILEFNTIDLIIADMNIDTLESYEFYDMLRLDVKFRDIPFVFLSSNEEDQEIAILKGISNFFLKPLDVEKLLETLHNLLSQTRASKNNHNYSIDYEEEIINEDSTSLLNQIIEDSNSIEKLIENHPNEDQLKKLVTQIKNNTDKLLSVSPADTYTF